MRSVCRNARPTAAWAVGWAIVAVAVLAVTCPSARAALADVGLDANGDPNPATGVPFWYMDNQAVVLELNLHPTLGLAEPPDPLNAYSVQTGFGGEAFYWTAETGVATSGGGALLVQALEVAYLNEAPAAGDQMVFTRLRFRVDVSDPGTYTITFPFGTRTFQVDTPGIGAINSTEDVGLIPMDFRGALNGNIGPFLKWDTGLPILDANGEKYIGDPGIPHTITGSPTGFNKFRIDGPNIGGPGVNFVETDLFSVSGKEAVNPGVLPTPATLDSATFSRTAAGAGTVTVLASSTAAATATVSGGPNLPGTPVAMTNDGTGKLSAVINLANATVLPATVSMTATHGVLAPTTRTGSLVDAVTITTCEYHNGTGLLLIAAASSDLLAPTPALNATGIGQLVNGALTIARTTPPATVTVTSTKGGSATATVIVKDPTPLTVTSATYSRTATGTGQVSVVATSIAAATATVEGGLNLPPGPQAMGNDGTGKLTVTIALADANVLPASVLVTAVGGAFHPVQVTATLTDAVTITKAEYYQEVGILRVFAVSSDGLGAAATLTLTGHGALVNGKLDVNLAAAPVNVTVTSSKGGTATKAVVVKGPLPPELTLPTVAVTGTAGQPFSFTFTVIGGDPMTMSASGTPPRLTVGKGTITGIATQPGTFLMTITATNASDSATGGITIVINEPVISGPASQADSDGDGFPDELEVALGDSKYDPQSTPMGDQPAPAPQPTGVAKAAIKLNFGRPTSVSDSIQLSGTLAQFIGFAPAGQEIVVNVGGVIRTFTVGAKGISLDKQLKVNAKNGKFSLRMKGNFATQLADEGLANQTVAGQQVTVSISMLVGVVGWYSDQRSMVYKAKQSKTGAAK